MKLNGFFTTKHYRDGELLGTATIDPNLVVDEGVNHILDVGLSGGTQDTTWFVGLIKSTGAVAAGDTAANINSTNIAWSESTEYSEANRQAFTDGGVASKSLSSTASPASFSINGTQTVTGAFLVGDNTKKGTTTAIYCASKFASSKAVTSGDTLTVAWTLTGADDGV